MEQVRHSSPSRRRSHRASGSDGENRADSYTENPRKRRRTRGYRGRESSSGSEGVGVGGGGGGDRAGGRDQSKRSSSAGSRDSDEEGRQRARGRRSRSPAHRRASPRRERYRSRSRSRGGRHRKDRVGDRDGRVGRDRPRRDRSRSRSRHRQKSEPAYDRRTDVQRTTVSSDGEEDGGHGSPARGQPRDRNRGQQMAPAVRGKPLPSQADSFALVLGVEPDKPKDKPNFGTTGTLAAASNAVTQADGSTIALKYHEPPEARKPPAAEQWKLFVFKGSDVVDTVSLNARSCWLVGRDAAVVDLLAEHPSISKQHAVLQFRYVEKRNEFGDKLGKVKPYLIDLESGNGTRLNKDKAPSRRFLELMHTDVIQFGHSTRDYVLMLA